MKAISNHAISCAHGKMIHFGNIGASRSHDFFRPWFFLSGCFLPFFWPKKSWDKKYPDMWLVPKNVRIFFAFLPQDFFCPISLFQGFLYANDVAVLCPIAYNTTMTSLQPFSTKSSLRFKIEFVMIWQKKSWGKRAKKILTRILFAILIIFVKSLKLQKTAWAKSIAGEKNCAIGAPQ